MLERPPSLELQPPSPSPLEPIRAERRAELFAQPDSLALPFPGEDKSLRQ